MTGRRRLARDFICTAPGMPTGRLNQWWYMSNCAPVEIRSIKLTDSPVIARAGSPPRWPRAWIARCRPCGQHCGPTTWVACVAVMLDHLGRCPWEP